MKTNLNTTRLKGRNHAPRCMLASARDLPSVAAGLTGVPNAVITSSHCACGKWKTRKHLIWPTLDVLKADVDHSLFVDYDTGTPVRKWVLELFGT